MERTHGRGRLVPLANGAVASALVALLAVVALVVKPPAPPGIAEFAPQASKPITKAPPGQASQDGTGVGGSCVVGQPCGVPSPSTSATPGPRASGSRAESVPSALQCYTWPDGSVTQTFDPQSPPCIASWPEAPKGNGGSTYRGVTGSTIVVAVRTSLVGESRYLPDLVAFMNSHYQMYGRQLKLVTYDSPSTLDPSTTYAAAQAALAVRPFAVLTGAHGDSSFNHALAQKQTLSVTVGDSQYSSRELIADAPYTWSYEPPDDVAQRNFAAFVCTSLRGKSARFSADASTATRRFAIVLERASGQREVSPAVLQQELNQRCGLVPQVVTVDGDDEYSANHTQAVTTMRNQGVTTILSLVGYGNQKLEDAANSVGWHPEWAYYGKLRQYPSVGTDKLSTQALGSFGLAPTNRIRPVESERQEVHWLAAPQPGRTRVEPAIYRELSLLAAGIQLAGPRLSPMAFAGGLHATTYPNPGAGAAPTYQAAAAFPTGQPWMLHDYAVWWPEAGSGNQLATNLCFVDRGRRWQLGTWVDLEARIRAVNAPCR